jgi:hypothetical protein
LTLSSETDLLESVTELVLPFVETPESLEPDTVILFDEYETAIIESLSQQYKN